MRTLFLAGLCAIALVSSSSSAVAQEQSTTAASSPTVRPIPNSDMMYKKRVWRRLDLREKQNKPMFSQNRQISKIIIEAVKRGELQAYKNDSLTSTFTSADVDENLKMPGMETFKDTLAEPDPDAPIIDSGPATFTARDLYTMDLVEDMIFDKKRSRMYHQIESVSLVIPSDKFEAGVEKTVAYFKFADLVKVFRANPEQAIWFNNRNDAQHKNLADAFDLWLFSSYITKVSNASDSDLSMTEGSGLRAIMASQNLAAEMIEYEYNLWSF